MSIMCSFICFWPSFFFFLFFFLLFQTSVGVPLFKTGLLNCLSWEGELICLKLCSLQNMSAQPLLVTYYSSKYYSRFTWSNQQNMSNWCLLFACKPHQELNLLHILLKFFSFFGNHLISNLFSFIVKFIAKQSI